MKKVGSLILILTLCVGALAMPAAADTSGEWEYTISNGNASITKYNGAGGKVSIPDTLGGYPVKWIENNTFSSISSTRIDVAIPTTVTWITGLAFNGCRSLMSITVEDGNPTYQSIDGVLFSKDKSKLICCPTGRSGKYVIPEGVTSIESYAFSGCANLTGIIIPEGIKLIQNYAFVGCRSITSISIPKSVVSIGHGSFAQSNSLSSLVVEPGNPNYKSVDSVIFSKDGSELICYAGGKPERHYSIPEGVTRIENHAFPGNTSVLESVYIPESVTEMGAEAFRNCYGLVSVKLPSRICNIGAFTFYGCRSLQSILIPKSVNTVGKYAFYGCNALTDVYYTGIQAQWKTVTIENNNEPLQKAAIHCSELVFVKPSETTDKPWITTAEYMGDTLTVTTEDGVSAPVFLAAYDRESGQMVGIYAAPCDGGEYTLSIGTDAKKYNWKLMFVDENTTAPLTCDYRLDFTA